MNVKVEEAIEYWEGLHKSFSKQLGNEENYFGRMHLQTTIDVLDTTISALKNPDSYKHGHWFLLDECSNAGVYCSVCHKKVYKEQYANQKLKSKFCPNCGAMMDEEFKRL